MTYATRRKFTPKWEGPYVQEVYSNCAYKIVDTEAV